MKCSNCGAELKEGCLYCSVCGKEAQLVSGLMDLEDVYLRSILKEDTEVREREASHTKEGKESNHRKEESGNLEAKKKHNNKLPIILTLCFLLVAIIIGTAVKFYVNYKNDHSYNYQMEMAEGELRDRNYEKALDYFAKALAISPNDITARMEMADIYLQQKSYDSAVVLLMDVLSLDKKNMDAYERLISIYDEKEEFEKIKELSKGIEDKKLLELFSDYLVSAPVFYPEGGSFDSYLTVNLISVDDNEIYFTKDGSDPVKYGTLYDEKEIKLDKSDTFVIKAVCRNARGIYSDVIEEEYKVQAKAPDYPKVTPDGGNFTKQTFVTIEAGEDCSVYYTWDGTDPSKYAERYTKPIEVPEGNNILSIIVIDNKSGLSSKIYRANYIYNADTEQEFEAESE